MDANFENFEGKARNNEFKSFSEFLQELDQIISKFNVALQTN